MARVLRIIERWTPWYGSQVKLATGLPTMREYLGSEEQAAEFESTMYQLE